MIQDIRLLGGVMLKAQEILSTEYKVDIVDCMTTSALAMKIFRMNYYDPKSFPIHIPSRNVDTFIRRGYYGGHADTPDCYYTDTDSAILGNPLPEDEISSWGLAKQHVNVEWFQSQYGNLSRTEEFTVERLFNIDWKSLNIEIGGDKKEIEIGKLREELQSRSAALLPEEPVMQPLTESPTECEHPTEAKKSKDLDAIPLSCPERRHFEKKPNTDFEPNSGEKKEDAGYTLHLGMGPMTKADSLLERARSAGIDPFLDIYSIGIPGYKMTPFMPFFMRKAYPL
ncbi:hypothetical protein Acr_00g0002470 [Actinidia rufa]|nr:hypothetical protein Acr_00g0002470 [Actinidia rufa]